MGNQYTHLDSHDRNRIQRLVAAGHSLRSIARTLDRPVSTVSREIKRNGPGCDEGQTYNAVHAGQVAHRRRRRGLVKLKVGSMLMNKVVDKMRQGWSPEQIAGRLRKMHPNDPSFHVSHETIYRTIYVTPRGELRKCQVPDDYILKNKRPLLISRKVLGAIVADWKEQKPSC